MDQTVTQRRVGVFLEPGRLDYELARRGLTARQLADVSGVHEVIISRARHGRVITARTLDRLAKGLLAAPLVEGIDLLIAEPKEKTAGAVPTPAVSKEVEVDAPVASSRPRRK